jgi:CBS domain-containing protein
MSVGSICQRDVDIVDEHSSVLTAAQRMRARAVGCLVVIDRGQLPVGILTDRDLVTRIIAEGHDPAQTVVADVMTSFPHLVSEDMPIETALGLMRQHGFRRLPVVDNGGRLAGLVTLDDILVLLADEFIQIGDLLSHPSARAATTVG